MTGTVRRWRAILAGTFAVFFALLATAAPSGAQESDSRNDLVVRSVDGRDPDAVEIQFLYSGPRETVPDLVIRENGDIVENTPPVLLADTDDFGIVLAIDTSGSMTENGAFERATDAAREFIRNKEADDQVALVSFSDSAQVVQQFIDDEAKLLEAVDRLGLAGLTTLHDAVRESVNLFEGTDLIPNIVLVTDGRDSASATSADVAAGLLAESNALLYAIGIESDDLDTGALESLVHPTGGVVLSGDAGDLASLYSDVQQRLRRQYRVSFESELDVRGPADLQLTIGTATTDASYTPGARLTSTLQVEPVERADRSGIEFLQSDIVLWLAIALLLAAVAAAVYAVGTTIVRDRPALDSVLQPYSDRYVAPPQDDDGPDRLATSAILQRAVELTGDFADRRGQLQRIEDMLERANLPLRAAEALFFYIVGAVIIGVIGILLAGNVAGGLLIMLFAFIVPPGVVLRLAARRRAQFQEQLPDMLGLLASTLRAGYSLMQGVEAAMQEVAEPMRKELQRVVTESRLGMPLETSLEAVAQRMNSRDFAWATMAIGIQREVGGNLAELLDTVAETMAARESLRRDIKSLTAEGRISAVVLGILPIAVGLLIYTMNGDYFGSLFEETIGIIMLIGSGVLMLFGFFWMSKIIDIEV